MFPHPRVRRDGAEEDTPPPRAGGTADAEGDREGVRDGMSAGMSESAGAAAGARGERLSLVEELVAELGAWTGAIVCRCHLPVGPILASDGAVHLDLAVFCSEPQGRAGQSTPE